VSLVLKLTCSGTDLLRASSQRWLYLLAGTTRDTSPSSCRAAAGSSGWNPAAASAGEALVQAQNQSASSPPQSLRWRPMFFTISLRVVAAWQQQLWICCSRCKSLQAHMQQHLQKGSFNSLTAHG
jgi:hypothetical protein